jgi:hypothetical protein
MTAFISVDVTLPILYIQEFLMEAEQSYRVKLAMYCREIQISNKYCIMYCIPTYIMGR